MSGDREGSLRAAWEVNVSAQTARDAQARERFMQIAQMRAVAVPVIMAQMQAIAGHDTSSRLGGVTAPTLVVHGTEDLMLGPQNGRLIASLVPGARLEIMDGVGHLFFWEQPRRSAELVRSLAAVPA